MLNVGELVNVCAAIEKEYGSDSKVVLRLFDPDKKLIYSNYAIGGTIFDDGTLCLDFRRYEHD